MRKIKTLFKKDEHGRYCIAQYNLLGGHGNDWDRDASIGSRVTASVPRRKFDGTPVYFNGEQWYHSAILKGGEGVDGFVELEVNHFSGKRYGWRPVEEHDELMKEAVSFKPFDLDISPGSREEVYEVASYELIGPRINGNPERLDSHRLIAHKRAPMISNVAEVPWTDLSAEDAFSVFKSILTNLPIEGIVLWDTEPWAKLRKVDFA